MSNPVGDCFKFCGLLRKPELYCPNIYTVPVYSLNSVIELEPACVVHVDDAEAERSKD